MKPIPKTDFKGTTYCQYGLIIFVPQEQENLEKINELKQKLREAIRQVLNACNISKYKDGGPVGDFAVFTKCLITNDNKRHIVSLFMGTEELYIDLFHLMMKRKVYYMNNNGEHFTTSGNLVNDKKSFKKWRQIWLMVEQDIEDKNIEQSDEE